MNNKELNTYANRIETAGLNRDAKVTDLHHYAVAVEVTPKTYGEIVDSMPDAFEYCFDYFDQTADKEESVFMFYLEDCNGKDVDAIENWLKTHTGWRTYEFKG